MARRKATVAQRDMSAMEVREDFLEADDSEIRRRSLRSALNMRALATGVVEARPGTVHLRGAGAAEIVHEIRISDGSRFGLLLDGTTLRVLDAAGTEVFSQAGLSWATSPEVWVENNGDRTVIGEPGTGLFLLEWDAGAWAFGSWAFAVAPGNETAQPYWKYNRDIRLTPSGYEGAIGLATNRFYFTSNQIGTRLRYGEREIQITSVTDGTTATGNVISPLPPGWTPSGLPTGSGDGDRSHPRMAGRPSMGP